MRAGFPLSVMILAAALAGMLAAERASAQGPTDAVFLGLAIADSISRDASGAFVLTGIRHVSRVNDFPFTEDLRVYTRWGGTGVHDIGISVWNVDTDETVVETAKTVTFSDTGITSFSHTFRGATFAESGTYDVETTLDGDVAAEYTLFMGATDDDFPDAPELVLSVPADSGSLDQGEAASVVGIADSFSFRRFPTLDSIALVTVWFSGDAGHEQRMEILDPTGVPIASSSPHPIPADAGKLSMIRDSFPDLTLPVRGTYTAVLYLDGEEVFEYPLPMQKQ